MGRTSAGIVAGMTAAALATIGFLASEAARTVPASFRSGSATATARAEAPVSSRAPGVPWRPFALPTRSGTGTRVVYSLRDDRVWLVDAPQKVRHTFKVVPGTVDPAPGTYAVTSRSIGVTGSDGVPVEHVVRFTRAGGVSIGFSAPVGAMTPPPGAEPNPLTGGIRESRADGTAMWKFATIGTKVVVVQ